MNTPTIAYLIDELRLGGATRQLATLVCALAGTVRPVVFCLSAGDDPLGPQLRDSGVTVHTFPRAFRSNPMLARRVRLRLRDERADLVHGWLEASNAWGWLAAKPLGLPVVFGVQSDRLTMGGPRGLAHRAMLRRSDAVTVNSRAGYRYLVDRAGIPIQRVTELPNWIDARTDPTSAPPTGVPVIAFAGRLVAMKRADVLIDAFAIMRTRGVRARLEIAGGGSEEEALRRRAQESGFADDIRFHGMLDDVGGLFARSACVVIPSEFEGLPNTALEAFAAGVPVVARPVGDLTELVREGETGTLVTGDTPDAIADAIARVLADQALRARVRTAGPALVRERFSIGAAIAILAPLYERLIAAAGARGHRGAR